MLLYTPGLSLPQGSQTSKEEGECSMPGKGTQGRNSLVPRCQCKSCMVKAELPKP